MKQGLSLRVSQHLALTPQLQQSIRLLQLSTLELSQEIEQMLDDNPFLERLAEEAAREEFGVDQADAPPPREEREDGADYSAAPSSTSTTSSAGDGAVDSTGDAEIASADGPESEPDWDGDGTIDVAPDDSEWGGDAPARNNNSSGDDDRADATELARSQESLQEHLHRQALALRLSPEDSAALRFLIESLNEDGYLEDSLPALASGLAGDDNDEFDELVHHFQVALGLLQSLEPVGVGARDLGECLTIQLRALAREQANDDDDEDSREALQVALAVCRQPLDLLAKRDFKRLAVLTHTREEQVRQALQLIARLEPKPGRRFVDVERNVIVPDVIVTRTGRGASMKLRVQLNPDVMPRLRVHDIYAGALKSHKSDGSQALGQRLQEARWFIKNIQQRFDTILRVSNAIVERQKNFFVHGELAMRPLVLREIADELGLHESTISRVTTAKYMATPYGTVELKYFFGSALGTETGGNASSTAVRALIKQFVGSESAKKPLSDSQISEMLKEQGIECARRTVAKYREALRIAPANLRKAL
ncbi:RNA polymerase factor sigma-54 [Xenophilus arseniciresistens]|uniref:RNA polymerase sigma-54 factor n=1 Tax=Xenophilus arseniciresistens TaxID=1283306 RepID=A0AAE3ND92_9BURK|nr:RNA polymerase factor sigma-54 [Xenophilus arseniciresistens]MDA7418706.1 RNA polymerase factor sigma-54 [Xenophilus arseniciresistens]